MGHLSFGCSERRENAEKREIGSKSLSDTTLSDVGRARDDQMKIGRIRRTTKMKAEKSNV